jgi:hypothetical protein
MYEMLASFCPGVRRHHSRCEWLVGALAFLLLLPRPSLGYELDSHYYLRFGLSLSTCFDWSEAHLIASGDWNMDANGTTHAEMNPVQRRNKIDWHAFGHSDKRFHELWLRSAAEKDLELRLIKLGQFMHFLEDWESHAGYGARMGHARDTYRGRDPDSLGNDPASNHRMVQSALDHLLNTCEDLGRLHDDRDRELIVLKTMLYSDGLMEALYEQSDPDWRRGKLGGFGEEGPKIKSANKKRIEEFIERRFMQLPEKNIPVDFEPGTERGIPPHLAIPYDRDGEIISNRSVKEAMARWAVASERSPDVTLSLDQVQIDYRGVKGQPSGWRLKLTAVNQGEIASPAGQIEIVVIDSDDERVLSQTSETLPMLGPGESREFRVRIRAKGRPEPDAIIGAFARVGDLSAMNDEDWLMTGDAENERPDIPEVTDLDPPPKGKETVHFLNPPRTFVIADAACILATAYTSGGDSPLKLDNAVFELIGGGFYPGYLVRGVPGRWSAMTTGAGLVAGKTFECYKPDPEVIDLLSLQDPKELRLAVTLEAEGTDPHTEEFPLDADFVRQVLNLFGAAE